MSISPAHLSRGGSSFTNLLKSVDAKAARQDEEEAESLFTTEHCYTSAGNMSFGVTTEELSHFVRQIFENPLTGHVKEKVLPGLEKFGGQEGLISKLRSNPNEGIEESEVSSQSRRCVGAASLTTGRPGSGEKGHVRREFRGA